MSVLLILIAIFSTGVARALSAANVFFHDINYLWGIVAQLLFYASPIIFVIGQVPSPFVNKWAAWTPTGAFVTAAHELLYDNVFPSIERWAYITVWGVVAAAVGTWVFSRLSPRFAEEI